MTLEEAQALYRDMSQERGRYIAVDSRGTEVCLDGDFEPDELEALAIMMRRLQEQQPESGK